MKKIFANGWFSVLAIAFCFGSVLSAMEQEADWAQIFTAELLARQFKGTVAADVYAKDLVVDSAHLTALQRAVKALAEGRPDVEGFRQLLLAVVREKEQLGKESLSEDDGVDRTHHFRVTFEDFSMGYEQVAGSCKGRIEGMFSFLRRYYRGLAAGGSPMTL